MASATDNFNRANGGLGTNWTTLTGASAPDISGNQARMPTAGTDAAFYNAFTPAGADMYARATLKTMPASASGAIGVMTRANNTSGGNCYFGLGADSGTPDLLYSFVSGVSTLIGTAAAGAAANDVLELQAVGSQQTLYKNGVSDISVTDSSVGAAGSGGIVAVVVSTLPTLDDFGVGDLPVATALTGQAGTFAAGTLAPSTAKALTGQAGTFAPGTLVATPQIPLIGQAGTFAAGTFSPSSSSNVALTGQAATFTPGTLTAAPQIGLVGQTAIFAPGALAPNTDVSLAGERGTFTPGTIAAVGDVTVALMGAAATFSTGLLVPSGGDVAFIGSNPGGGGGSSGDHAGRKHVQTIHLVRRKKREEPEPEPVELAPIVAPPIPDLVIEPKAVAEIAQSLKTEPPSTWAGDLAADAALRAGIAVEAEKLEALRAAQREEEEAIVTLLVLLDEYE